MTERKFRLVIERNGSSFSDECEVLVDVNILLMSKCRYTVFKVFIPKWMKDMLGKIDYEIVKNKIEDMGKELCLGDDGMEIRISV